MKSVSDAKLAAQEEDLCTSSETILGFGLSILQGKIPAVHGRH